MDHRYKLNLSGNDSASDDEADLMILEEFDENLPNSAARKTSKRIVCCYYCECPMRNNDTISFLSDFGTKFYHLECLRWISYIKCKRT